MTDETRDGEDPSRRDDPHASRLAERAAHLRVRADAFARAAASDGRTHAAREAALLDLVEELHDLADEVARIARDLARDDLERG